MKYVSYLFSLLGLLGLCSCVYEIPLVEKATKPIDSSLAGAWQKIPAAGEKESDWTETLLLVPFSKTEYIAVCTPSRDEAAICLPGTDKILFRAYPIEIADLSLIQIEWLQLYSKNGTRFQVCRCKIRDGILTVETLNREVVDPGITDADLLHETVLENVKNPDLFSNPVQYRRLEQ
ncbi:MAG: hypothetical protein MUC65_03340 [Pontiellaceae bacterium]|jgi:hypothetical protein|nr:hypothetical protein [Pontiellaceae bacterium]